MKYFKLFFLLMEKQASFCEQSGDHACQRPFPPPILSTCDWIVPEEDFLQISYVGGASVWLGEAGRTQTTTGGCGGGSVLNHENLWSKYKDQRTWGKSSDVGHTQVDKLGNITTNKSRLRLSVVTSSLPCALR